MRILISSYVFSPSVGGIETVSGLLAPEFVKAGHEVIVVTKTKMDDGISRSFTVYRKPSAAKLLELTRWCDVYFQSNISLRFAWPLLLVRRPWVIAHQTWLGRPGGWFEWPSALKLFLLNFSTNVAISLSLAKGLSVPAIVIGNPYADTIFKLRANVPRDRDLVYLGRLVSEKGLDLLFHALKALRIRGLTVRLSIIGSGSEEPVLRNLAEKLGLGGQIDFFGTKSNEELAHLLNAHRVLVVPSRLPEPFGIVALEGIASGCVVVASRSGGLPDAVGPCGVTYEKDDPIALADALHAVLTQPDLRKALRQDSEKHLDQFKPPAVAARYLKVLAQAAIKNPRRLLIYSTLPLIGGNSTITLNVARQFRQQGWKVLILTRHQAAHGLSEANIRLLVEMGCEVRKLTRENGKFGWPTLCALIWIYAHGRGQVFITLCKGMVSPVVSWLGGFKKSIFYLITHENVEKGLQHLARVKRFYTDFAVISPITSGPLRELLGPGKPICWLPQFSDFEAGKRGLGETGKNRNLAFGFLGTLSADKGVGLLLEMWPALQGGADLRIAGDGPLREAVAAAAARRQNGPGAIYYDGAFSAAGRDEFLQKFLESIDYLIVPSVNTMEGIPTVILEALSCGVPALASDLGGTACFGLDWLKPRHPGVVHLFPLNQMKETVEDFIGRSFPTREDRNACIEYYQEWFSNQAILKRWTDLLDAPEPVSAVSGTERS